MQLYHDHLKIPLQINTVEHLLNCAIEMSAAEKRGKMDEEEGTRKGRKTSKKKVGMKLDLVRSVV